MRENVPDERVEELIVPVLINQNLNESCIFLNENHACLSLKSYDISERPFQRFIIIFFPLIWLKPRPNDRNMSQHCWMQHVVCVWPPCCDLLGVVGSNLTISNLNQRHPTCCNTSQHGGQAHTTCCTQQFCNMLRWHVMIVWPGL